ncbi:MAG: hypothetical protein AABX11_01620 [Nanoarchaeota archaeon]
MNKRGKWAIWVSIVFVVLLLIGMFFYFALFKPSGNVVTLQNPAKDLSLKETEQQFDESFVSYLLYSIKAYNLHNPPLSSNYPKIEILVGESVYYAVVKDSQVMVSKDVLDEVDVRIVTSLSEAAKMVKYPDSVKQSFEEGVSRIDLIASKTSLFSKGYLSLYTEITGKSITGNVVRIYSD